VNALPALLPTPIGPVDGVPLWLHHSQSGIRNHPYHSRLLQRCCLPIDQLLPHKKGRGGSGWKTTLECGPPRAPRQGLPSTQDTVKLVNDYIFVACNLDVDKKRGTVNHSLRGDVLWAWLRGIASVSGTEDQRFESRQGVRL
jgi:hypothetical protein